MLLALARQLEGVADHPRNAPASKNSLLQSHFFRRSFVEPAANVRVFPFAIFAHDHEVDVARLPVLERRFDALEQTHRTKIYVLLKRSANGNQQAPQRDVVGHAGMPHRAQKNRIERPQ